MWSVVCGLVVNSSFKSDVSFDPHGRVVSRQVFDLFIYVLFIMYSSLCIFFLFIIIICYYCLWFIVQCLLFVVYLFLKNIRLPSPCRIPQAFLFIYFFS